MAILAIVSEVRMRNDRNVNALSLLSVRERQVPNLVLEGRSSKHIAAIIGVKLGSIHTYRSRLKTKLEVSDLPSLVRLAIRQGVIKLPKSP